MPVGTVKYYGVFFTFFFTYLVFILGKFREGGKLEIPKTGEAYLIIVRKFPNKWKGMHPCPQPVKLI